MAFYRPSQSQNDREAKIAAHVHKEVAQEARRLKLSFPHAREVADRPQPRSLFGPIIPAIVTTAIGPATGGAGSYGTGAVQFYYQDDIDAASMTADTDNASVVCRNWYANSGTITTGTPVFVVWWSNAYWFLTSDCPS
jgi:hypothetical protein